MLHTLARADRAACGRVRPGDASRQSPARDIITRAGRSTAPGWRGAASTGGSRAQRAGRPASRATAQASAGASTGFNM
jgi:hypothetical protein